MEIAVDIGGTFTDLAAYDHETGKARFAKTLSTPSDLARGVMEVLELGDVDVARAESFTHGSTVAINTMIELRGTKTALLTTEGFRDVLELARGNRPDSYDITFKRSEPLVPRELRLEVAERIDARGKVVRSVDGESIQPLVARLLEQGVASVAISFLNAYANPEHEKEVGDLVREADPGLFVSLSHALSRQFREYERTSTTVVNAYVGPVVSRYLESMDQALRSRGFAKGFFVMESNGGVLTVDAAKERPVLLMESGPVGGAIASAKLGDLLDHPNVVAFDMGGTTAKACVIEGGIPPVTDIYWVGRYARGYPVQMPFVEVLEVGAGGGSIIWIDEVGALKIGPRSAGASPGPACFGFGGADATITDAHMFLGAISSSAFMSGGMTLDPAASETAIRSVADKLGVDPTRVASGAVKIANATMAEFVRRTTIERGRDPREFVMVAYGGAGPLHARDVAEELGIPVVVIPPLPGNFSAIGMSVADLRHDYVRTFAAPVGTSTLQTLELELQSMEHEARERIEVEVGSDVEIPVHRFADMRYVGQEHAVKVPLPPTITDADLESMIGAFNAEYHARYGHSSPEVDVELVNLRLSAMARVKEGMSLERIGAMDGTREGPPPSTQRDVFFEQAGGFVSCPIYKRDDLRAGDRFTGPAIVEDASSTVVVGVRDTVGVNELGCLVIQVGGPS